MGKPYQPKPRAYGINSVAKNLTTFASPTYLVQAQNTSDDLWDITNDDTDGSFIHAYKDGTTLYWGRDLDNKVILTQAATSWHIYKITNTELGRESYLFYEPGAPSPGKVATLQSFASNANPDSVGPPNILMAEYGAGNPDLQNFLLY